MYYITTCYIAYVTMDWFFPCNVIYYITMVT